MTLRLARSRHDLPLLWDGVPVTWDAWSDYRSTLPLHVPADKMACHECGAVDESLIAWGIRPPAESTFTTTTTKTTRSGHKYEAQVEVPAYPVHDIYAARCRHCGHDVVTDTRTNETWDLDETDYGPEGSTGDTLF
ncbi:hypothetical protein [Pseudarthrobacter sp. NIBRBAC000502770]|uniref:hypothetical protein n=1 Tax=Pseudarthrobacter sp. NIBRBAC000502770 TaxID=2590785 RepID=UPI0011401A87|nr:hypothetical protein [Pseudarthrobacter sp. NIBRBAC000502770]QDG87138.1 hypothetical protein NIBR502770_00475 [Pseudarthrobacter sp. NIBRBAC000502770]